MHAITENGEYGDKTERCIFNAGIGSVLEDFKALQYFSCANQLLADGSSNHNCFFAGKEWMSYRPAPGTQCCPGNVNRFMPNYVLNMWETGENEVRCRLYGASRMETQLGGGKVVIEEETDYPFNDQIVFNVSADVPFIFKLRIPKWTTAFYLTVNGEPMQCYPDNGYVRVPIEGNAELCMRFKSVVEKHLNHGGIYFVKGPLVYALGGKERRVAQIQKGKRFPSYDIYADFEWRYAVDEECETEFCESKSADITARNEMPHIALTARRIEGWDFEKPKYVQRCIDLYKKQYEYVRGDFVFTPRFLPAVHGGVKEKIVLYPYGVQKMRLTVFPCKRILESKPEDK